MHEEILTPDQIAVLARLTSVATVSEFYLAGGTALALRHGHRRSVDFDFFREDPFDARDLSDALAESFHDYERLPSGRDTLYVRLGDVTTSFFRLPYPLLSPTEPTPWGFDLASDRDIAAMKLEAIAGRGSRKDFVDMFVLCRDALTLDDVFSAFESKYGTGRSERYHRLRALDYFADAEQEPMPEMLVSITWQQVTAFFRAEARRLLATELTD